MMKKYCGVYLDVRDRFTGETGTILKVVKNPDGASRAMVLTDMSSKEIEVLYVDGCVSGFQK